MLNEWFQSNSHPGTRLGNKKIESTAREFALRQVLSELAWSPPQGESIEVENSSRVVPARRVVFRDHDGMTPFPSFARERRSPAVPLYDGGRQMLALIVARRGDQLLFMPARCYRSSAAVA